MESSPPNSKRTASVVTPLNPGMPTGGYSVRPDIEPASVRQTVSLRAIFTGVVLSFLSYACLLALGFAIGGSSLAGIIQQSQNASGLSIGSGIWMVASLLLSLYFGSYFAGRVSGMVPVRLGGVQGMVISAIFFFFIAAQVGSALGLIGQGVGGAVSGVSGAAGDLAGNPQVQSTVEDALGGLNLASPPDVVVRGLASRLLRGDSTGARDYLARQAGISPADAQARIDTFKANFDSTVKNIGTTAARALSYAGWTLFMGIVLGTLAASWGGSNGVRRNLKLSDRDLEIRRRSIAA